MVVGTQPRAAAEDAPTPIGVVVAGAVVAGAGVAGGVGGSAAAEDTGVPSGGVPEASTSAAPVPAPASTSPCEFSVVLRVPDDVDARGTLCFLTPQHTCPFTKLAQLCDSELEWIDRCICRGLSNRQIKRLAAN